MAWGRGRKLHRLLGDAISRRSSLSRMKTGQSSQIRITSTTKQLSSSYCGAAERADIRPKQLSVFPGLYNSPVADALWSTPSTISMKVLPFKRDGPAQVNLLTKSPSESRTSVLYNFSNDAVLREQYQNPWNFLRIGKLLEDLDALAGTIAMKHCADNDSTTRPWLVVTASVDKISLKKPLRIDKDLKLAGVVTWVGRSSMKVEMQVVQPPSDSHGGDEPALVASFTFVARDSKTNQSAPVNRLAPETDEEKRLYHASDQQEKLRKQERAGHHDWNNGVIAEKVQALVAESQILIEMPALSDRGTILIENTRLESAIICQLQQMNLHGRIFGGFLMHQAFELAFSTCYVFCERRPVFLEVDHVDFVKAVDVGDLLRFRSCVLYTENEGTRQPKIHVEVQAIVTRPESRTSEVSNTFYFTFTLGPEHTKSGEASIRKVLPASEEEARRCIVRYDADHQV